MIDKEKIKQKFSNLPKQALVNIIEESVKQFPRKMKQFILHAENGNTSETSYYSYQIRESYAYIFHDSHLNFLCHKIQEAADKKELDNMMVLAEQLKLYSDIFLHQLEELKIETNNE